MRRPRRAGEEEGVRQAEGNVPVSQRATQRDIDRLRNRVVIRALDRTKAR